MAFFATGDSSNPGAGVDWANYGKPKDPYEKEAREKALANNYWGVGKYAGNAAGGAEGVAAYMDNSDSEAFRKRLDADLATLGSRKAPYAANTTIGAGAKYTPAALGTAGTYGGATLNLGDDAAARAQQISALSALRARAAGTATAPGVAQLYASLDKGNAAATSAAAAARAPNAGMAMRSLAAQKAGAAQQAASDATILKAQDQQAAQTALANLETSMRAGDMAGAQAQAGLTNNAAMFSADALNKFAAARAAGDQQGSMFNASVAQKQSEMDQEIALANMRAYLQSQGLNDAAIAARMGMYQDSLNKEKRDEMAFWDFVSGADRFNSSMSWQQQQYQDQQNAAKWAAAAGAVGAGVGYFNQQEPEKKAAPTTGTYGPDGRPTSDARQKTNVRTGSPVLRKWLDDLGGGR